MSKDTRILVVDDNDDIRDLYSLWLANRFDVRAAPDGDAALSSLETPADVVLLDRNMPGPSGLEVAAEIRERGAAGSILMISSDPRRFELTGSPVDRYVQKPVSREDLLSAVGSLASSPRSAIPS
jgi:DNA-binding response OmpR family regulator